MVITVIGAGHIGSAIAAELTTRDEVTVVKICDAHTRSLQTLHDTVQSDKLRSFQVDARDIGTLSSIMDGSDCVIGSTSPNLNPKLAAECLRIGSHFIDLGGLPDILQQQVELTREAEEAGLWIVPNNGLDPGLVNILTLTGIRRFDRARSARIRVGDIPLKPEPPFRFRLAWTPEKLIDDYTNPAPMVRGGTVTTAEPLSELETISFDEPFGELEAFHTAGRLSSLVDALDRPLDYLDHKTIRWPGHAEQMRFILGLGFAEPKSIDVRTHLTYRDVFIRRMKKHLGGDFEDVVLCRIAISGELDGRTQTLVYQLVDTYNKEAGLTAMRRCTSIPVVTTAILLASGKIEGGGVQPPECVLPGETFIDDVRKRGLDIRETWFDGERSIAQEPGSGAGA